MESITTIATKVNTTSTEITIENLNSELFSAIKENNFQKVKYCVDKATEIGTIIDAANARDDNDNTVLQIAARYSNNPEVIAFLIGKGADTNAKDKNYWTPLHYAAQYNSNFEIFKLLIDKGANISAKTNYGLTALKLTDKIELIKLLVNKLAALDNIVHLHAASKYGTSKIVEIFINKDTDINVKTKSGSTPLHLAAKYNNDPEVIKLLLEKGADIKHKNDLDWTPLHLAAQYNTNPDIIKLLLEKGADIDTKGNDWKPLHLAARYNNNFEVIKLLIEKGADINSKTNSGFTSLNLTNKIELVKLLVNKLAAVDNIKPLHAATKYGTSKVVELFINENTDINVKTNLGLTPLHLATEQGDLTVITLLLNNGADFSAKDSEDCTPLHKAARYNNNPEVIKFLIGKGAVVNAKGSNNKTPLHSAAQYNNNPEVIKLLIEKGADVNVKNNNNETPLHYAVEYKNNTEVMKLIIEKGADINAKDNNNRKPLDTAIYYSNTKAAEMLREQKKRGIQRIRRSIQPQIVASSSAKTSFLLDDLFSWTKNMLSGLSNQGFLALPFVQRGKTSVSPSFSQFDINSVILFNFAVRLFTGKKCIASNNESFLSTKHIIEKRMDHNAINVVDNFVNILKTTNANRNIKEFMYSFKSSCRLNDNLHFLHKLRCSKKDNSFN